MTWEIQLNGSAFLASVDSLIRDWLANIEAPATGVTWVDRVDLLGPIELVAGAIRVPVRVYQTSEADVTGHPNTEPQGPSSTTVDTDILLGSGTIDGDQMSLPVSSSSVEARLPAQTLSVAVQMAAVTGLLRVPPTRISFTPDRAVLHIVADPDPQRRLPLGSDWAVVLPSPWVQQELETQARVKGFVIDTTYREQEGRPYFDFDAETRLNLPSPLTNLPAQVRGSITLTVQSNVSTQLIATVSGTARPTDENWVGTVASALVPLPDGRIPFSMSFAVAQLPAFRFLASSGSVSSLSAADNNLLLSGTATSPEPAPMEGPTFQRSDWSNLFWVGAESSVHVGHPQTAMSTASLTLVGPGHVIRTEEPDDDEVFFIAVPSPTTTIDGPTVHLTITAEEIERRALGVGQTSYKLIVHTSRGHRLIDFGIPPQPKRDATGGITNADVIAIPEPALIEPTIESPISDPPDQSGQDLSAADLIHIVGSDGPRVLLGRRPSTKLSVPGAFRRRL